MLKTYIGTKMIQAEPAYRIDGKIYTLDVPIPKALNRQEGYKVVYPDGYVSWSPKGVFEKAYLPLTVNPDLRTDKPSISQEMVDDFVSKVDTWTIGDKTTVCLVTLRNGFTMIESSSCVSAENYDQALGKDICVQNAKEKVWKFLGFLLQTAVGGIDN